MILQGLGYLFTDIIQYPFISLAGNLRTHIRRVHSKSASDGKEFHCALCPCSFTKVGSLNAHCGKFHADHRLAAAANMDKENSQRSPDQSAQENEEHFLCLGKFILNSSWLTLFWFLISWSFPKEAYQMHTTFMLFPAYAHWSTCFTWYFQAIPVSLGHSSSSLV